MNDTIAVPIMRGFGMDAGAVNVLVGASAEDVQLTESDVTYIIAPLLEGDYNQAESAQQGKKD